MNYNWNYFDRVYCISTPEAYLKRNRVRSIAKQLNTKIDIRVFERSPKGSNQGCGEAHISIIKEAYQKNLQRIVIFEDDIILSFMSPSILADIVRFLEHKKNWDLFYFGVVPDPRKEGYCTAREGNFYRVRSICTHAYALNHGVIKKYQDLCDTPYDFLINPFDFILRDDLELYSYARFPTQFYQETGSKLPQSLINFYFLLLQIYVYYIGGNIYHPIYIVIIAVILFYILLRVTAKTNNPL